eukprot:1155940-Pyramimonas_sp.AAC.1
MELGATLCSARNPQCDTCPLQVRPPSTVLKSRGADYHNITSFYGLPVPITARMHSTPQNAPTTISGVHMRIIWGVELSASLPLLAQEDPYNEEILYATYFIT